MTKLIFIFLYNYKIFFNLTLVECLDIELIYLKLNWIYNHYPKMNIHTKNKIPKLNNLINKWENELCNYR